MPDTPLTYCVSCGQSKGFTNLPSQYAAKRWPDAPHIHDRMLCQCHHCGATFPVESIDASVREEGD